MRRRLMMRLNARLRLNFLHLFRCFWGHCWMSLLHLGQRSFWQMKCLQHLREKKEKKEEEKQKKRTKSLGSWSPWQ
jgi:hypothetical protein